MLRHKFNAVRTDVDDIKFPSKAQARYYHDLKLRQKAGEVEMFLMEVPFHLPGGVKYVVDFIEFLKDGSVEIVDVKGFETKEFKIKKKIVEAIYPIKLKIVNYKK